jgi:hypothetical protein
VTDDGATVFLNVHYSGWELAASHEFTMQGAQRTGLAAVGRDQVLFFAGTTLRLLDDSLQVVSEVTIADGEPIDIEEQDEVIWLAYPDRLVKSNPVTNLTELANWETMVVPPEITIQSIAGCSGKIAAFDGFNGKIHLFDTTGRVLLSWDAAGSSLERGDIVCGEVNGEPRLIQTDGGGSNWHFFPTGWLPE